MRSAHSPFPMQGVGLKASDGAALPALPEGQLKVRLCFLSGFSLGRLCSLTPSDAHPAVSVDTGDGGEPFL